MKPGATAQQGDTQLAVSLYDISVGSYLQGVGAARGFLDKALAHCREKGIDPEEVVETRLIDDMHPFRFQVQQIAKHSAGAVAALQSGSFALNREAPDHDYAGLQALLAEAEASLKAVAPAEIEACEAKEVLFPLPNHTPRFKAVDFVLSFSLPNFHFHCATAYDILRQAGAPIGKRDFLGAVRVIL
jgi:uncharacterized protein